MDRSHAVGCPKLRDPKAKCTCHLDKTMRMLAEEGIVRGDNIVISGNQFEQPITIIGDHIMLSNNFITVNEGPALIVSK